MKTVLSIQIGTLPTRAFFLTLSSCLLAVVVDAADHQRSFDPNSAGQISGSIGNWTLDVKNSTISDAAINESVDNAGGAGIFDSVRVAWFPQYSLINNLTSLSADAKAGIDEQIRRANLRLSGKTLFLSPSSNGPYAGSYIGSDGKVIVAKWVKAMELSRDRYVNAGKTITYNGVFNEPDNTGGKLTPTSFVQIRNAMSGWGGVVNVGPCSITAGTGATWLDTIHSQISKGSTHALSTTTLSDYRNFDARAISYALQTWNSEAHNSSEIMVGASRNFARVCWWGKITSGRGMLMQVVGSPRLFFDTDFNTQPDGKWSTTAAYKDGPQSIWIFAGNVTNISTTITYTSTTIPVSWDGSGLTLSHSITLGPVGSATDEAAVHVTW
jgi:hypothetical protein